MTALIVIIVIALCGLFWLDAMRAREQALRVCGKTCREMDVELLDETVALSRLDFTRGKDGRLRWRRCYGFEFNIDGTRRHRGRLVLVGQAVDTMQLDMPEGYTTLQQSREASD